MKIPFISALVLLTALVPAAPEPGLLAEDPGSVLITLDPQGTAYGHEFLWKADTTGTNYEESVVAYAGGIAYVGSCATHGQGHDKLFALDCADGGILWSYPTGPGYVGPVIDKGALYFGTCTHGNFPANEYVYAFDRITGAVLWRRQIYGGVAESIQYDDTQIYFCSFTGGAKAYALDKNDGRTIWTQTPGLTYCANKPMLKDGALYVAFSHPGGLLIKLNKADGKVIWSKTLAAGPWDNSITSDGQGRVFLALYYGRSMNAYAEADGRLLWTYPLAGGPLSFNAYHNGIVFIADTAGYVYALDATNGQLIWRTKIGATVDIGSPTLSGGLLFIGTRDFAEGAFFALDEATGKILWKYKIGASVTCPPAIADGMMLCGSDGWFTYAFDFGVGSGEWPLHRYDRLNTACSPTGLTQWQHVKAVCVAAGNTTKCQVTSLYDHEISQVTLTLDHDVYWYDRDGGFLQGKSDRFTLTHLAPGAVVDLVFAPVPLDWKELHPAASPPARHGQALVQDGGMGRILLFGGQDAGFFQDTWTWDGANWTPLAPAARPPGRSGHALAYDPAAQRVMLFGGWNGSGLGDAWLWDGKDWTPAFPPLSPPARQGHAMAHDRARGRTVLFGGAGATILGDTWLWDGKDWMQALPPLSPPARQGHAMAYDEARREVVLFGGGNGSELNDTWLWNGTTWTPATPATRPPARTGHALADDGARRQVVLFGGQTGGTALGDTWLWNGTNWAPGAGGPPSRQGLGMAYDGGRQQVVLFGGRDGKALGDTWVHRLPAGFTTFGAGCPGSQGVPLLTTCPGACPVIGKNFGVEATHVFSTGPLPVMLLGFGKQVPAIGLDFLGMAGCRSYVQMPLAFPFHSRSGNTAQWYVDIPHETALVGAPFFVQGLIFDNGPGANPVGLITSNGGAAMIGSGRQ